MAEMVTYLRVTLEYVQMRDHTKNPEKKGNHIIIFRKRMLSKANMGFDSS